MAAESFFKRWSRLKSTGTTPLPAGDEAVRAPEPVRPPSGSGRESNKGLHKEPHKEADKESPSKESPSQALPTPHDVARLNADSDYSAFMARDVDKAVRRMALKKLFSDPHFNKMDGLDIYIDDYTKPSPLPAAMLASLKHAENIFGPKPEEANSTLRDDTSRDDTPSVTDAAVDSPQSTARVSGEDSGEGHAGQPASMPRTVARACEPPEDCSGHSEGNTPST